MTAQSVPVVILHHGDRHGRVYSMRMARINITVPDDVAERARAAGLNVSQVTAAALVAELDRRAKVAELDVYLADLAVEDGPVSAAERDAAERWVGQLDEATGSAAAAGVRRRSA